MIVDLSELRPDECVFAVHGRIVVVDSMGVAGTGDTIADAQACLDGVHDEYMGPRRSVSDER